MCYYYLHILHILPKKSCLQDRLNYFISLLFVSIGPARLDEKIKFKKPTKRSVIPTEESAADESGSDAVKKKRDETKKSKKSSASRPAQNKSLLSFGDEEEEEEG